MGLLGIFKRRKKVPTLDERRQLLLRTGRLTEGRIIDSETLPNGDEVVYFVYSVNGTDYESSDCLTSDQRLDPIAYAPGAKVGIRFDVRNHGNAIVV